MLTLVSQAELMSILSEQDSNEHRVAIQVQSGVLSDCCQIEKLCVAMDKERSALHNVLPSAHQARISAACTVC